MFELLLLLLPAQATLDTAGQDTVFYGGKLVRFRAKTEEVVLLDSAWVRFRDMTVYSDSIHYDTRIHRLAAFGDVLFNSGDENITGTMLQYDLDTRKGMMRSARTEVQDGFFWAEEVWLVKEKTINARRGYYTTCPRDPPHYVFYGPRMKLFMDDVAIAEPVVFKLFGVPLLAAPFWFVPVASERKSGIMPFKVGHAVGQGWYAKNLAYYWVINDYADATFYADIMSEKGIQPRLEAVYRVQPYAEGSIQASYIQELDTRKQRYSLNAENVSERFFFDTDLRARADYVSDRSYAPDYAEEPLDWLKQDVFSFAEVSRAFGRVTKATARVEHETEFARNRRSTLLPSARFSFGARPLPFGWSVSPGISLKNSLEAQSDSLGTDTLRLAERSAAATFGLSSPGYSLGKAGELDISGSVGLNGGRCYRNSVLDREYLPVSTRLSAGMSQKPFGVLNIYEDVSFSRSDDLTDTMTAAPRYTGSLSGNFPLYKVFGVEALGMHGLLHTARPSLGIDYTPRVTESGFFGKITMDSAATANLNFALLNYFEAKVGEEKHKAKLGNVDFRTSYNLATEHLSPLRAVMGITPLQSIAGLQLQANAVASFNFDSLDLGDDYAVSTAFNLDKTLSWNRKQGTRTEESRDSVAQVQDTIGQPTLTDDDQQSEGWRIQLGLNHTYSRTTNMVTGTVGLTVPGWRFTLNSMGYNFASKQLTDYSITIWKDLCCWEAIVNIDRLGGRWKYDFQVQIKKLPDVKFGKSTFRSFLPE